MLHSPLSLCARLATRRPWTILGVALLLCAASIVSSARLLELNANTDDLIARDRPFMDAYRDLLREFGDLEYIYVVVEKPPENGARARQCVDFIASRLARLHEIPDIFHSIEPYEQLRIASRAMSDEELREFAAVSGAFGALLQATDDGAAPVIHAASQKLEALIREGRNMPEPEQQRLAGEATFLLETIAAALPGSPSAGELAFLLQRDIEREYLRSESGELYFIAIMPVKDFGTLHVIQGPLEAIRGVLDEARAAFPDVNLGLTGKPVLQADELATTDRDMTRAAILAIILVAIGFMLVLGGFWHPALAVAALLCGIAWTFGLATIWPGQLNLLSIIFTLILVGVGIDFGVHLVTRYREERASRTIESAIYTALLTAGRGNVLGAVTSSIAFLMAMFTQFQGLRELGFIAGMGLLLCLASMTLVLPALLVVFDRRFPARNGVATGAHPPLGALEERNWNRLLNRPGLILAVAGIITIAILPGSMRLGFEFNLLQLQARGLESVKWEHRILDDSSETWFGAVVVDSQKEALDVIARAEPQPTVVKVSSVFDVIEPDSPQRDRLRAALHQIGPQMNADDDWNARDLEALAQNLSLIARGARAEGAPEAETARLAALAEQLRALAGLMSEEPQSAPHASSQEFSAREAIDEATRRVGESLHVILEGDRMTMREALPRAVRNRFVSPAGSYLVALHPLENVWEFLPMRRFVTDMRRVDADATGVPITQYESLIEMRRAFIVAALLAFGAVVLLLWIDLRGIRDALLALVPLMLGMLWLVCAMGLLGIKFNLANFFAVPILIGIGVDSGIHIMRRHREDPPGKPQLGTTRRAVFMTSMTSLIGFGMLITASHRGVHSLGIVMAMGAGFLLIASTIMLPALLAWLERHHWYHGGAEAQVERPPVRKRPQPRSRRSRRRLAQKQASGMHWE